MKHSWLKKTARAPDTENDLSFPPPYSEQAKYLRLADKFLSTDKQRNVVPIDSSKLFQHAKKGQKAA